MLFADSPLERLHLDPELVQSVGEDPELMRKLARSGFRTIVAVNHPDVGGDGSLIDQAKDAIDEIDEAEDSEITDLVDEFLTERLNDPDAIQETLKNDERILQAERNKRIAETSALLKCGLSEKPKFKKMILQIGIQPPLNEDDPWTMLSDDPNPDPLDVIISHTPNLVLLDSSLKGSSLELQPEDISFFDKHRAGSTEDFEDETGGSSGTNLRRDDFKIHNDGTVSLQNMNDESMNDPSNEDAIYRQFKPTPLHLSSVKPRILGVVKREDLEESLKHNPLQATASPSSTLQLTHNQDADSINWSPVSIAPWLGYMEPATAKNIEGQYIVVANEDADQVAILGLVRRLET